MWVGSREASSLPWEEVSQMLTTQVTHGLETREVIDRREIVGFNEFSETEDDPLWKKFLGQVIIKSSSLTVSQRLFLFALE